MIIVWIRTKNNHASHYRLDTNENHLDTNNNHLDTNDFI